MKEKRKVRGELRIYLQWPLLLSVLVVAMNLIVGILNAVAGLVMFAFTLVYVGIALWLYFYRKRRLLGGLVEFSSDYSWVQKHLLSEMNLPYAPGWQASRCPGARLLPVCCPRRRIPSRPTKYPR